MHTRAGDEQLGRADKADPGTTQHHVGWAEGDGRIENGERRSPVVSLQHVYYYEPDQVEEFMGLCFLHQEEYRQRPRGKGKASGSGKYQSHRVIHLEVATNEGAHDGTVAAIRQAFLGFETNPRVFLPVFFGGF
jgi:hypothetical protein